MTVSSEVLELTIPQAAAFLGVKRNAVSTRLKGRFPIPRQGNKMIRSDDLGEWQREKIERDMRLEVSTDPNSFNSNTELARKNKELADKVALDNQIRRGELIEADAVEQAWSNILMRVRSRILSMPTSLAPILVGEEDQVNIQSIIEEHVREALDELATGLGEDDGEDDAE